MAKRRTNPADIPAAARETRDRVREAVERTIDATRGSAAETRTRAQGAVDDVVGTVDELVRGAEAGLARVRPATQDDVRELRAELRAIVRRLDAIEERLPAKRGGGGQGSGRSKRG